MDSINILIVDDSQTQAEHLKNLLEENNYRVFVKRNGSDALNNIEKIKPSLLITDIIMPIMDGYELASNIRKQSQFSSIPIILLTSLSETEDIIRGMECGANYFLTKPYDDKYLIMRVKDALNIQKIRMRDKSSDKVSIMLNGKEHIISAEKSQIIDLLVSIYDAAVQKNQQLLEARLRERELNNVLERNVEERTNDLRIEINKNIELYNNLKTHTIKLEEEIQAHKETEAELVTSLKEKEIMLKEIYHRVKNNLQVISSLVNLQASNEKDEKLLRSLRETDMRIKSIALVHEMLYQTDNLANIQMEEYIKKMSTHICDLYNLNARVNYDIDVKEVSLTLEKAIPCGLIINELLSNAFKHAFPDSRGGSVKISLKHDDGMITLIVKDDGIGGMDQDKKYKTSIGIELIRNLTRQLDGKIAIENINGTNVTIHFPSH